MQGDIATYIGLVTGLVGVWAAFWKWVMEPSLDRRFMRKIECDKRHDDCRTTYGDNMDEIKAELHNLRSVVDSQAAHIEWIRKTLERLEK